MTQRITGIVQTIVLVLALVGTASARDRFDYLEPENGIFSRNGPAPYDLALRDLLLDEHYSSMCGMLAVPDLLPEWSVYLIRKQRPRDVETHVIYKTMKESIRTQMHNQIDKNSKDGVVRDWRQKQTTALAQIKKTVVRIKTPISKSTAAILEQVWDVMLARVHYPKPDEILIVLDGVTYHVSQFKGETLFRSGTTRSPVKGSNTGTLVELAEELRRYALADEKERPQIGIIITNKAKSLLEKLKNE